MTRLVFFIMLVFSSSVLASERYAVVVGVSDYEYDEPKAFPDLEGPKYDVESISKWLKNSWDVKSDKNLKVLLDKQASKKNILKALDDFSAVAKKGDTLFFYFTGHGSSGKADVPLINLPYETGALVPADFKPRDQQGQLLSHEALQEQLIVGRFDLRERFIKLDKRGVTVWMVADSCNSGNSVRALDNKQPVKRLMSLRGLKGNDSSWETPESCQGDCSGRLPVLSYPYEKVIFFAAATEAEVAMDITSHDIALKKESTHDGNAHGAFTDAFLRVANNPESKDYSYEDFFDEITLELDDNCKRCNQTPIMLPTATQSLAREAIDRKIYSVASNSSVATSKPTQLDKPLDNVLTVYLMPHLKQHAKLLDQLNITRVMEAAGADFRLLLIDNRWLVRDRKNQLIYTFPVDQQNPTVLRNWFKSRQWLKQLQVLSKQKAQAFNLAMNRFEGLNNKKPLLENSEVYFTLLSEQAAYILLIDFQSDGTLSALYPYHPSEYQRIEANQQITFPSQQGNNINPIHVQPPFGTETLLLFAFSKEEALIKQLAPLQDVSYEHPLMDKLLERIAKGHGIASTTLSFQTQPKQQ